MVNVAHHCRSDLFVLASAGSSPAGTNDEGVQGGLDASQREALLASFPQELSRPSKVP